LTDFFKHIRNSIFCKIVSLVFLFIFIFCLIHFIIPNKNIDVDIDDVVISNADSQDYIIKDNLKLPFGSWRFYFDYTSDIDYGCYLTLIDEDGGLVSNGAITYLGLDTVSFDCFNYFPNNKFSVMGEYSGGYIHISDISIAETDLIWSKILCSSLFFCLLILGLSYFRRLCTEGCISDNYKKVFIAVNVISLLASIPFFSAKITTGADLGFHLLRVEGISESIKAGIFPTRVEPQWIQDYGYADAIFYCPLFLYFPGILRLIGYNVSEAISIFNVTVNIITAWISYYSYKEIFKDYKTGVVLCGVYTLSIYRLNTFYYIGMTGVASAMMFLPLVLLGLWRIVFDNNDGDSPFKKEIRRILPLGIGFSGVIQSHVLSSEITLFVCIVVCLLHIVSIIKRKALGSIIFAAMLAFSICAWFIIPFADYYLTQDMGIKHAGARQIQSQGFYVAQHFILFSKYEGWNGPQASHSLGIGLIPVAFLTAFIILWIGRKVKKDFTGLAAFAKSSCIAALVLFVLTLNIFPWDKIQATSKIIMPLIGSIEYPHRFQAWLYTFTCVVIGYLIKYVKDNNYRFAKYLIITSVFIYIVTGSIFLINTNYTGTSQILLANPEAMGNGYTPGNQYMKYGTDPDLNKYNRFEVGDGILIKEKEKGALSAEILCENNSGKDSWIEVPLNAYKGYKAYSGNEELEIVEGYNNVIRVIVPSDFSGRITIKFCSPWYWRVGEIISAITIIGLLVYAFVRLRNKRKLLNAEIQ
jgi:hypothetical protein